MMGARGVALGLGRINLNDLNGLTSVQARQQAAQARAMAAKATKKKKSKVVVKKRVDRQTFWAACRATIFGSILLVLGAAMSTVGYYSVPLATHFTNDTVTIVDRSVEIQLRSLSYVGPIVMGVGAFILMIACVMTLESRDKHATIIHEYTKASKTPSTQPPSQSDKESSSKQQLLKHDANVVNNNNNLLPDQNDNHIDSVNNDDNDQHETASNTRSSNPSANTCTTSLPANTLALISCGETTIGNGSQKAAASRSGSAPLDSIAGKFRLADPRGLLNRFLNDQTGLIHKMHAKHQSNPKLSNKDLPKQSSSLDVHGSEQEPVPQRNVKSEDLGMQRIIADVHLLPSSSTVFGGAEGSSSHAPLVQQESCHLTTATPSSLSTPSHACHKHSTLDSYGQSFYTPAEYGPTKSHWRKGRSGSSHQYSHSLPCGSVSAGCTPMINEFRKKCDLAVGSLHSVSSYVTVDSSFVPDANDNHNLLNHNSA